LRIGIAEHFVEQATLLNSVVFDSGERCVSEREMCLPPTDGSRPMWSTSIHPTFRAPTTTVT
jgi:hypothetical protein